ncbi:GH92 family glycosyl hydrolase [Sporolactobacillus sp. Y61]|uniref:GH92 family glycosyl hydrolase n=1 Tax=Sporolactobacillus sp. Y61 TaxID=3160863 RepID=A0AAU8IFD2_9BACL
MSEKYTTKIFTGLLCLVLILPFVPQPLMPKAHARSASGDFFTSFEQWDPVPDWKSSAEAGSGGKKLSSGITSSSGGHKLNTMRTVAAPGPVNLYASPKQAGWTGKRALSYSGTVSGNSDSYAVNRLFRVKIPVHKDTRLSYYVAPVSREKNKMSPVSGYVAVDLAFSDGTYLHQISRAVDQDGIRMTASAQGASRTLKTGQWNYKDVDIGKVAKGKTITRILLAYHAPKADVSFSGAVDDIRIENTGDQSSDKEPVDYVNILRGTQSNPAAPEGETVPLVGVPNGFSYWSPAINSSSASHFYPYRENNNPDNLPEIQSFSLGHSPNSRTSDRQSFQVMPSGFHGTPSASRLNRGLAFHREDEDAAPDHYRVTFTNGLKAEMAADSHSAIFHFTFNGRDGNLIFDHLTNDGKLTLNARDGTLEGFSDDRSSDTDQGRRLYFYATVDRPVIDWSKLSGENRDHMTAFYKFDTSKNKSVTLKVAVSLISIDQAKKNLELELGGKTRFADVSKRARSAWNRRLSKVSLPGAGDAQKTTFYSSLYRLYLYPNAGYENTGSKKKPDDRYAAPEEATHAENSAVKTGAPIHKGRNYVNSDFAFSAQTAWPAYILLEPELTGRLINGMLLNKGASGDILNGPSAAYAALALADAAAKDVPGLHTDQLYKRLARYASVSGPVGQQTDRVILQSDAGKKNEALDDALAAKISDFAMGNLAEKLAADQPSNRALMDDSRYFLKRSADYVHLLDPSAMKKDPGRSADDVSLPYIHDPGHQAFNVPQDGQGLANLYGGRKALQEKLDDFFTTSPDEEALKKPEATLAAAGQLGRFVFDTPASAGTPYMYAFTGSPWKTQAAVRKIMNRFYTGESIGGGFLGKDTGAMLSGFYLFSAAGFFPLQKGTDNYVLGAPYFKHMILHLPGGRDLVINAPKLSNKNKYVQAVRFNGAAIEQTSLSHDLLKSGGILTFDMGSAPSDWGSSAGDLPDSLTPLSTDDSSIYSAALTDLTGQKAEITAPDATDVRHLTDNLSGTAATFPDPVVSVDVQFRSLSNRVKMYTLTSSASGRSSDPKSWRLLGSNDGVHWDTLDTRSDESFAWRSMTRAFTIKNPKSYASYRLEISSKSGKGPLAVGEYQLLGYTGIDSGFDVMRHSLMKQFEKDSLSESETASLSYALNQAQQAFKSGNLSASVYYLQTYVQMIHSDSFNTDAPDQARKQLSADAHAIVNLLSD